MAEFMTGSGVYLFQLMLLILLAVVGALVLWLHFQFQRFKKMNDSMPFLSDQLAQNLREVQKSMQDVSLTVRQDMPLLEEKIAEARSMVQEIEYVLSRGENVVGTKAVNQSRPVQSKPVSVPSQVEESKPADDLGVESSAASLVQRIVQKESKVSEPSQPAKRRATPVYGAQAYGAAIERGVEHSSENEEDLRRILQGRI